MTFRWQSTRPTRTPSDRSTSNLSPLAVRTFPRGLSNRHNVPTGTVASRISHLQSLANPGVAPPASPTGSRRRETSRTGFGRRLNSRFGQPASRNREPDDDEYSQVDVHHSFLGLTNPRKNHEEEHARAHLFKDKKSTYPHSWRSRQTTNSHLVKNSEVLKARSKSSAETYVFSDESVDHTIDRFRRDLGPEHKMFDSEVSLNTTSSMRRQSVVDLYHEYGIERPARLVSSRGPSPSRIDDTPRPAHAQWTCHNCSWTNNSSTPNCWRCDVSVIDEKIDVSDGAGTSKMEKKARKPKPKPIFEPQTPRPPKAIRLSRKKSTPPIKFPSFDAKVTTTASKDSRGSSPNNPIASKRSEKTPRNVSQKLRQQQPAPEQPKQPLMTPGLSPSRAQMKKVQESPFLKADRGTVVRSKKRPKDGSSNSPEKSECVSPSCRAAYGGHKPYRHTITCSWNIRRIREHTDKGYTADTSHVGDTTASYNSFAIASESDSHVFHSAPEFRSDVSQTAKGELEGETYSLKPVSCDGYPRTGHEFLGSPFGPDTVGECQHCPDDCGCEACQKAPHTVRCCVHHDHSKIPHYHLIPRDEATDFATGKPAKVPTDEKSATLSENPSHTSTVVPPKPLARKKSSLPKPPIPPKKMSLKEFQPSKFPGQNINKTAPGRLIDGQLKSTLKEGSLSDATTILSNNVTSSTTRLQSLQTGITTPERAVLSQQVRQDKVVPKPLQESEADEDSPVTTRWDAPLKRSPKNLPSGFKLRDKASAPLLAKRLHEHQEELRSHRGGKSEDTLVTSVPFHKLQVATSKGLKDYNDNSVSPVIPNQKKKLRLKAGSRVAAMNSMDGSPSSLENQRLSQSNDGGVEGGSGSEWREEGSVPMRNSDMHECIWRKLFLEEQGGNENGSESGKQIDIGLQRGGVKGIKLVIELFGKEDLVLEGEF